MKTKVFKTKDSSCYEYLLTIEPECDNLYCVAKVYDVSELIDIGDNDIMINLCIKNNDPIVSIQVFKKYYFPTFKQDIQMYHGEGLEEFFRMMDFAIKHTLSEYLTTEKL